MMLRVLRQQLLLYLQQKSNALDLASPVGLGTAFGVVYAGSDGERGLERETGFEPATACLEGRNSTTELLPLTLTRIRRRSGDGQLLG